MTLVLAHARAATLELFRYPSFSIPTLLFPSMFFLFFVSAQREGSPVLVASYVGFAILGVAFFQFGVGIAAERTSPWEAFLRTLPLAVRVRFSARIVSALAFALAAGALLVVTALVTTDARLSPQRWLALAGVALVGSVPFALLGIALGYLASPRGALPLANLLYLTLSFAGGLWTGPNLPGVVAEISPYLPTRQFAEVLWGAAEGGLGPGSAWLALGGFTVFFAVAAQFGYRRDEGERFR